MKLSNTQIDANKVIMFLCAALVGAVGYYIVELKQDIDMLEIIVRKLQAAVEAIATP